MPHHISSKTTTKTVRFADSSNEAYTYGPDHLPSQTATYSCRRLVQRPSSSQHQHSYVYSQSRLLKDTHSPKDNNSSPPSSSTFCSPECSQYSPLTTHTVLLLYPCRHLGHFLLNHLQHPTDYDTQSPSALSRRTFLRHQLCSNSTNLSIHHASASTCLRTSHRTS